MKNKRLEEILENNMKARNNDKIMYIEFLKKYYTASKYEDAVLERILLQAPGISSLVRQRRFYQNELGLYKPLDEVIKSRKIKAEEIKNKIRENKKDNIFDALFRWLKK